VKHLIFIVTVTLLFLRNDILVGQSPKRPNTSPPRSETQYVKRDLDGFHIMIDRRLISNESDKAALECLGDRLTEAVNAFPSGYHVPMQEVVIWVDQGRPANITNMGVSEIGLYYPIGVVDNTTGRAMEKNGGIQLYADPFLLEPGASWVRKRAPSALFHEFAHAMHDRVLGIDDRDVLSAFEQALDRRLYEKVEVHEYDDDGRYTIVFKRAFAATNHLEYFAELSEGYLGEKKIFFPFKRGDIKAHDPVGYSTMESFWREEQYAVVNGFAGGVKVMGTGPNDRWSCQLFELAAGEKKSFKAWPRLGLVVNTPEGKKLCFTPLVDKACNLNPNDGKAKRGEK
jgi:predicted Zn-dependent protease with MMP-like domain